VNRHIPFKVRYASACAPETAHQRTGIRRGRQAVRPQTQLTWEQIEELGLQDAWAVHDPDAARIMVALLLDDEDIDSHLDA